MPHDTTKHQRLLQCTYAEAIFKLHRTFHSEFREDQVRIAKTVATIYEADWVQVYQHLKDGYP